MSAEDLEKGSMKPMEVETGLKTLGAGGAARPSPLTTRDIS